jgi:NAD(P)-dependent dehydrogenase (short-subunit alcohol dehydrogenase family)
LQGEKTEVFMAQLEGKVALITGASSGLGREFALSLSKNGANVIVAARRKQMLESLCDEIKALAKRNEEDGTRSGEAFAIELDVSASEPAIGAAVEKAWAVFGYIDVLVNNAGIRGRILFPFPISGCGARSCLNSHSFIYKI